MPKSIEEWMASTSETPDFLVTPYVTRKGITFLYGKTGSGKSPLTWEIARCVSLGIPFLGLPVKQGRVLYLERETDASLVTHRWQFLPQPRGTWEIEFLDRSPATAFTALASSAYDLVIWNSLRKFLPTASTNLGELVSPFYDSLKVNFPNAAHILIAHERKTASEESNAPRREEFSGSMAWLDQCQNGVQVITTPHYHAMRHTKSQVARLHDEVRFQLEGDGGTVRALDNELLALLQGAPEALSVRQKVTWAARKSGKSESTIWRVIRDHSYPT